MGFDTTWRIEELGDDPSAEEFAKVAREVSVHASKSEGGTTVATEGAFPDPAKAAGKLPGVVVVHRGFSGSPPPSTLHEHDVSPGEERPRRARGRKVGRRGHASAGRAGGYAS